MVYSFICLESTVNISIVDNIANFKMLFIDGAETVSTVLNNSKIRFMKLPVILITCGRKKYMLLRIYKYECYSEISIQKYS
jgi:predicted glycosyltransferase